MLPWALERARALLSVRSLGGFVLYAVLFFVFIFIYKAARWWAAPEDPSIALRNADWLISAERNLGLFVVPTVQEFTQNSGLEPVSTWIYTGIHQPGYIGFFVVLWFVGRSVFPFAWRWFWVANGMAVLFFWLFPLAPPRLVPSLGLDDPTHTTLQLGGSTTWFIESDFRNVYAAMPSLHVGYPLMFATVIFFLLGARRFAWTIWLWPLLVFWSVVASANHYVLDAVGGALVVASSAWLVTIIWPNLERPWARGADRETQSFRPEGRPARLE